MTLELLELCELRNLQSVRLEPHPRLNILWGRNGQGKTSLLEAIFLLANGKSFRSSRFQDVIRYGARECRLAAVVDDGGSHRKLEMRLDALQKRRFLDGKTAAGADFFALLQPILFTPDDVPVIKGGPNGRRDMLDRAVFTWKRNFLQLSLEYGRVVRQRNRVLKEKQPPTAVAAWDSPLIDLGGRIRHERALFVEAIQPLFAQIYRDISDGQEKAELCYAHRPGLADCHRGLETELQDRQERERCMGTTLAGPHRDDPDFHLDGISARRFASQGQQRSLALAFRIALVRLLEQEQQKSPLLLLDDMASELDPQREDYLVKFLVAHRGQVFITTTDHRLFIDLKGEQAGFYRLADGRLKVN